MAFDLAAFEAMVDGFHRTMELHTDLADVRVADDTWTLREMVGHLIDSASNNHQRFIRLQLEQQLKFPGYDAEAWRDASGVIGLDYGFLVRFWKQYNTFLLHLIRRIDPGALSNVWVTDKGRDSLELLVKDYFAHLDLHRNLFDQRVGEIRKHLRGE